MPTGEIVRIPLSGRNLPEAVARHLLEHHTGNLPDLSGITVLVPNHRAGQDFARALAREAGLPALIPPQITPLKVWAQQHSTTEAEPLARRLARLHGVLRQQTWLGEVDRWALAGELLQLADELSAARLGSEASARIRAHNDAKLDRETRLIEEVWRAMNSSGSDPQACYAEALRQIKPAGSIYGFALGPLTALEQHALQGMAGHAPVTLFELAAQDRTAPVLHTLATAWAESETPLRARASQLASAHPDSPVQASIHLNPAPHLEAEAEGIATWVTEQLQAGRKTIALIALDRETARRTRALLERVDVLVADETGWTLSTTAAAAVIDRWLECLASDFPHAELLDLLKSPFVLHETPDRQDAVLALEIAMRKQGVAQGLNDIQKLADECTPSPLTGEGWGEGESEPPPKKSQCAFLDTLASAAQNFSQTRAPLAVWLQRLLASLDAIQAAAPLQADAAGASVLDTLRQLANELAPDTEKYRFNEWRRWLNLALETATFTDTRVTSPIVLTSLPNARGRVFDAVALIGADAAHLPARAAPGLFSQSVRAQLGLSTAQDQIAQTTEDLLQLLSQGNALLSWQAWHNDEPNPASSYVLRLQALHQAAWGAPLTTQSIARPPAMHAGICAATQQPAPVVQSHQLPLRYSPTAYQTLLDCPYRFFVRHVLGLRELDEADDPLDKSDYGNALHRILKTFHDRQPPPQREDALALLAEISAREFAKLPAWTAVAWHSKWHNIQPAYIDAWLAWTAQGWRYQAGEQDYAITHEIAGLGAVTLHGRVDRVDHHTDGTLTVIDYKTAASSKLKKWSENPAEHVQLPFYAWLANAAAAYLAINETPVTSQILDDETDVKAITLRLPQLLEKIASGTPLTANGIAATCQHCDARGLCRKGMWVSAASS